MNTELEKREYILNQIRKTSNKKYENYCITRIYHLLNRDDVKFVIQQLFKIDNKIALADLYLPQINLIIEIDEPYHDDEKQKIEDKIREDEIISNYIKKKILTHEVITHKLEIKRIKIANNSLKNINKQIEDIVLFINKKIKEQGDDFISWDCFYKEPQYYIDKGYIDTEMNASFRTINDVSDLFNKGYKGTQQAWFKVFKNSDKLYVWCPRLKIYEKDSEGMNYENEIDGEYIYEKIKKEGSNPIQFVNEILEKPEIRFVFANYMDESNKRSYKFKGVYELDIEKTKKLNIRAWKKISNRIELTQFFK